MKQIGFLLLLLIVMVLSSGCYLNSTVDASTIGVRLDGGRIVECVGPGIQSDLGFFARLDTVSSNTITQQVEDKSIVTSDLQPVGATITMQYRRKTDCPSVKDALTNWSVLAHSDAELQKTMESIANQGIKVAVSQFTLNQLLADRTGMATTIQKDLELQTSKFNVEVISIGVKNVAPAQAYLDVLEQKALLTVQVEAEQRRQDLIKQQSANTQLQRDQDILIQQKQLLLEQANTATQLEIAQRQGAITKAQNQVYTDNKEAYQLAVLDRMQKILGDKSVVYFLTPGTNMNVLLGQFAGTPLPVITGTTPTK